jgi:hypothetical protein
MKGLGKTKNRVTEKKNSVGVGKIHNHIAWHIQKGALQLWFTWSST